MRKTVVTPSETQFKHLEVNDDDGEMDETKRKSRNLSEKKRRDQFNTLINELNSVVSANGRKMDKSTILKAAMNTLNIYNENVARSREYEITKEWKPSFLTNEEYTYLMLEAIGGFTLVFSSCGKILYASSSLAAGLGYILDDMLNSSIYDLVAESDRAYFENMFFISTVNSQCVQNEDNPINFKCHFLRKSSTFEELVYEPAEFLGKIKPQEHQNIPTNQDIMLEFNKSLIFVGFVRLLTPHLYSDVALHDYLKTEFVSHHNFEWKFIFLDERAPPIVGYSPFEVLGTSGYDYYHFDDLDDIVNHHQTLMVQDEGVSGFYRFLTKGHQWIWLQTTSCITRRGWNSRIEFIVCTHRVIDPINPCEKKIPDSFPTFSSSGSGSAKTSPPSWKSTTSTTSGTDNYYYEGEDKAELSSLQRCERFSNYGYSTASSSSSRNLHCYKKRKYVRKFQNMNKSFSEYPSNSSDTSSSNSNGHHSSFVTTRHVARNTPPRLKLEQKCDVQRVKTNSSLEACLQQKCEELQQIIAERQEELKVVSEQLFLARCNSSRGENENTIHNLITTPQLSENSAIEQSSSETDFELYSYENSSRRT